MQDNDLVIGCTRNPRASNYKVPGHKSLGPELAEIIEQFFKERPHVNNDILQAIGEPKGQVRGPRKEETIECRHRLARLLHADLRDGPHLTEVCAPMARAWIRASNDPDIPFAG